MKGRSLARVAANHAPPVVRRLARRLLAPKLQPLDRTPFGRFERDDGSTVELWSGYRDAVKGRWRSFYWPVRVLVELEEQVELDTPAVEVLAALRGSRTLPLALTELAAVAVDAASHHPALVGEGTTVDEETGVRPLAVVPPAAQLARLARVYGETGSRLLADLRSHGVRPSTSRLLEIGCGTGYATFALARLGVREIVGIDLELDGVQSAVERDLVRNVLDAGAGGRARLEQADAEHLADHDESYDVVFSFSALEHMQRLPEVLAEIRRVTRRGGLSIHVVDPWFSPQGGHRMCVLDAPWLHVRLSEAEFARYVHELRPHEAATALDFYRNGFQQPPRTLLALRRLVEEAGFDVLEWDERQDLFRNHAALVEAGLLDELTGPHPGLSRADLLTGALRIVLRRR